MTTFNMDYPGVATALTTTSYDRTGMNLKAREKLRSGKNKLDKHMGFYYSCATLLLCSRQ